MGRPVLSIIDSRSGRAGPAVVDATQRTGPSQSNIPSSSPDATASSSTLRPPLLGQVPVVVKQEPVDDRALLPPIRTSSEEPSLSSPSRTAAIASGDQDVKPGLVDFLRSALDAGVASAARERKLEQDVARLRARLRACKAAVREVRGGETSSALWAE